MKQLFIALLLFPFALSAQNRLGSNAQDTVVVNGDTVVITHGAIVVEPVIVNANGDSCYSITWNAFGLSSSNQGGCNTYVVFHDKFNRQIADKNQQIPQSVVDVWGTSNDPIDDYILFMNPRFVRYVSKSK